MQEKKSILESSLASPSHSRSSLVVTRQNLRNFPPSKMCPRRLSPKYSFFTMNEKNEKKIPRYLFSQLVYDCQGKLLIFRVLEDLID